MGRKSKILPYDLIASGDISQATIIGKTTTVKETDVVQINVDWSASQVTSGTFKIQSSMDLDPASSSAKWVDLDFGATISISGLTGNHQLIIQQVSFLHIRPVYTRTNGSTTGTINAKLFATTVGA